MAEARRYQAKVERSTTAHNGGDWRQAVEMLVGWVPEGATEQVVADAINDAAG